MSKQIFHLFANFIMLQNALVITPERTVFERLQFLALPGQAM